MKRVKSFLTSLLLLAIFLSTSTPSLAATQNSKVALTEGPAFIEAIPENNDAGQISPAAVSGEGQMYGNSGEFIIYSPSSSWFAHMNFQVVGDGIDEVAISVIDPNGRILSSFGGTNFFIMRQNTWRYYNFNSAPAGNYRVQFTVGGGDYVTVYASLHDLHA